MFVCELHTEERSSAHSLAIEIRSSHSLIRHQQTEERTAILPMLQEVTIGTRNSLDPRRRTIRGTLFIVMLRRVAQLPRVSTLTLDIILSRTMDTPLLFTMTKEPVLDVVSWSVSSPLSLWSLTTSAAILDMRAHSTLAARSKLASSATIPSSTLTKCRDFLQNVSSAECTFMLVSLYRCWKVMPSIRTYLNLLLNLWSGLTYDSAGLVLGHYLDQSKQNDPWKSSSTSLQLLTTGRTLATPLSFIRRMASALLAESWKRSSRFTVHNRPQIEHSVMLRDRNVFELTWFVIKGSLLQWFAAFAVLSWSHGGFFLGLIFFLETSSSSRLLVVQQSPHPCRLLHSPHRSVRNPLPRWSQVVHLPSALAWQQYQSIGIAVTVV